MTDALDHLADFLSQTPRTRAEAWLQDGFAKWLKDGDTLPHLRCLGLPASPLGVLRLQRNRYLREAAAMLSDDRYQAAKELHRWLTRYRRRWPTLRHLTAPPPDADELEQIIWRAFKALPPPKTVEMVRRILFEK